MATPDRKADRTRQSRTLRKATETDAAPAVSPVDTAVSREARIGSGTIGDHAVNQVRAAPDSLAAGTVSRMVQRKAEVSRRTASGSAPEPAADSDTETTTPGTDEAFDKATSGSAREVPYRRDMEDAFGTDFGEVKAHTGGASARSGLEALSAEAAARGSKVAFRDDQPSKETVAHELTHVVQQRQGAGRQADTPNKRTVSGVYSTSDGAERQAEAVGRAVASGGSAARWMGGSVSGPTSVRLSRTPRKSPTENLDEALNTNPVDPATVQAAVKKFGAKDRASLRDDSGRMAKVLKVYKDHSLDALDLANRLEGSILLTVQWLRQAGQVVNLGQGGFAKRFRKAPVTEFQALVASEPDRAAVRENAPTLGPLDVKAIAKSGEATAALLKDPASLDWTMGSVKGLDGLLSRLPKAGRKALQTDGSALDALLGHKEAGTGDVVGFLKGVGLGPTEVVPKVAIAKAEKQLAGPEFPPWFLGKTKRAQLDPFVDGTDLDILKEAAPKEVPPLDIKALSKAAELGSVIHDKRKYQDWVTEVQGWRALLDAVAGKASSAMVKTLAASGGNWEAFGTDLGAQRSGGEGVAARAAIDALFAATPTSNLEVMKRLFKARFGVQVGTSGDKAASDRLKGGGHVESDFGPKGLRRIYNAYKVLPPSQAESGVMTIMGRHGSTSAGNPQGFSYNAFTQISLEYGEGNTEAKDKGVYAGKGDAKFGMNLLDTVAVHELGHRVDTGAKYSSKAAFHALADWTSHPRNANLVASLKTHMTSPLGSLKLTADEKSLVDKAAALALVNRRDDDSQIYDDLKQAYKDLGKKETPDKGDKHRSLEDLWLEIQWTNLFNHIVAGHAKKAAWWDEPFAYLPTRQYHEAYQYEAGWWSYDNKYRASKLSNYQFRNPADHFAELYATYWCSQPQGSKVPAAMKKWFEDEGLNK
jgi:hypothetical protein